MKWVGHVKCTEERGGAYRFWRGNLREGDHLEDLGVGGRIIKVDLQEVGWWGHNALIWWRIGIGGRLL